LKQSFVRSVIEETIEYIENNIRCKITLEDLAQVCNVSKFHLHRVVTSATGQPLMDYIQSRRLSESALVLMRSKTRVIDIALDYGLKHEQSYIRAFRKQFGTTPGRFRTGHEELPLIGRFDTSGIKDALDGVIFEPNLILKPAFLTVGRQYRIPILENEITYMATRVGNEFFFNDRLTVPNRIRENVFIGLTRFCGDDTFTYYIPSVQVSSPEHVPSGMSLNRFQPQMYAVFRYIGNFHAAHLTIRHLQKIWDYIDEWLATSLYRRSKPFHFESIDNRLSSEHYCEVDLYIPVNLAASHS